MRDGLRAEIAARVFLTLGALLPYWRLLTFSVVFVTDDYFASDIFNGELPGRALDRPADPSGPGCPSGRASSARGSARRGRRPIPSGWPLFVAAASRGRARPVRDRAAARCGARHLRAGAALRRRSHGRGPGRHRLRGFRLHRLPAQTSLDRLHGRVAAGRAAADRSRRSARRDRRSTTPARRALFMAAFGLVFARTGAFRLSAVGLHLRAGLRRLRALPRRSPIASPARAVARVRSALLGGTRRCHGPAGAAAGAVVLLPLSALGSVSDRAEPLGYVWSHGLAYWPPNILTFLVPYINGDISDNTLHGPAVLLGGLRLRRRRDVPAGNLRRAFVSGGARWSCS